jgi:hypothetical protein
LTTLFTTQPQFWAGEYSVTREYRTEIINSRSGKQQRRALRDQPRKTVRYTSVVAGDCLREFRTAMASAQRAQALIPDRVTFATTGGLGSGATSVVVDPVPEWIVEDAELVLVSAATQGRRTVASVAGTTVNFDQSEAVVYPAGTRLCQGLVGWLAGEIQTENLSRRGVAVASIELLVDPITGVTEAVGTAGTTLGGREVFLVRPDSWEPISIAHVQPFGEVDFGLNAVTRYWNQAFATQMWEGTYTACSTAKVTALRQFFDRMEGQRGEFYMPTHEPDLVLASGVTSAGTGMTVTGTDAATFNGSTTHKAVAIRKTDGSFVINTVTSIGTSGGNSVFVMGSGWSETVALADVAMVSWMPTWRFAKDEQTFRYGQRATVADCRMAFEMLETLAVET